MIQFFYLIGIVLLFSFGRAERFRVYEILVDENWMESKVSKQALIQAAGREPFVQLSAYGELQKASSGVWSLDQRYTFEYLESLSGGRTISRKVGLWVQVSELPEGQYQVEYEQVRLDGWRRFGVNHEGLQPIFNTREFSYSGPIDGISMHGGLGVGGAREYFLIERIAED